MNSLTRYGVMAMPFVRRYAAASGRVPLPKPILSQRLVSKKFLTRKFTSKPSQNLSPRGDSRGNVQNTGWFNSFNTGKAIKISGGGTVILLLAGGLGVWYCNENPEKNICTDARKLFDLPPIKKK